MEKEPQSDRPRGGQPPAAAGRSAPGGREMARIARWLRQTHFRRALFGVSEKDVWRKIGELNELYKLALAAERARYDTLLEEWRAYIAAGGDPGALGEERR